MMIISKAAIMTILLGISLIANVWAQSNKLSFDPKLPITLDADSSEFDIKNGKLTFTGLRISQGTLGIEADKAEASKLDFEDSVWIFSENVVINNAGILIYCERAEINFKEHRLIDAVVTGNPARFLHPATKDSKPKEGQANEIQYDLTAGIISMVGDAWLSDGSNEISGARISYDISRDYIIANGEDGQVSMKINPPEPAREPTEEQTPPQADQ